jgi:hypothetical protein
MGKLIRFPLERRLPENETTERVVSNFNSWFESLVKPQPKPYDWEKEGVFGGW